MRTAVPVRSIQVHYVIRTDHAHLELLIKEVSLTLTTGSHVVFINWRYHTGRCGDWITARRVRLRVDCESTSLAEGPALQRIGQSCF